MTAIILSSITSAIPTFSGRRRPYVHRTAAAAFPTHLTPLPWRRQKHPRGDVVVVKAGLPSSSTLILAFFMPLSLLVGTVLISIRIADDLDKKYLDELAMNEALRGEEEALEEEGEEEEREEEEEQVEEEEEERGTPRSSRGREDAEFVEEATSTATAAAPRTRNRPKREA